MKIIEIERFFDDRYIVTCKPSFIKRLLGFKNFTQVISKIVNHQNIVLYKDSNGNYYGEGTFLHTELNNFDKAVG